MIWKIPLADLDLGPEETEAVQQVLQSRWLTMGAMTEQFETEFAQFTGAKYAFAVSNCTVGLHLACLAVGLGSGDEVIAPSLSFVATTNAILYTGAKPIFADITGENDLTISPDAIESCITPQTKAIMIMHYAGYACDMARIMAIAQKHGLAVIEDAAHAAGSELQGRSLGTWGEIGCYSFFSNKNMTTGEGGMVVTNDEKLAQKMRIQRSHGMTTLTWDRHLGHAFSYDVVDLGYNYRIDEIRAAIGMVQLRKLHANNNRRQELTALYRARLKAGSANMLLPFDHHPGTSACHIMPVLLPEAGQRASFMERMKLNGIQTSIHYPPIHMFTYYRKMQSTPLVLPVTEELAARQVTLPLYPRMSGSDIELVVQAVKGSLRG